MIAADFKSEAERTVISMVLGLKRGVVELAEHDPEWETLAAETIARLRRVLNSAANDIQHVGSTAVRGIKAKPIIDIAAAVNSFDDIAALTPALEAEGFMERRWSPGEGEQMLYAVGGTPRLTTGLRRA